MPTPFIAWIDMTAPARRPSRRSSQEMCEPMPGTSPKAITSKVPPSDSFALRAASISATIASLAAGVEAAHRRLVDAREVVGREAVALRAR